MYEQPPLLRCIETFICVSSSMHDSDIGCIKEKLYKKSEVWRRPELNLFKFNLILKVNSMRKFSCHSFVFFFLSLVYSFPNKSLVSITMWERKRWRVWRRKWNLHFQCTARMGRVIVSLLLYFIWNFSKASCLLLGTEEIDIEKQRVWEDVRRRATEWKIGKFSRNSMLFVSQIYMSICIKHPIIFHFKYAKRMCNQILCILRDHFLVDCRRSLMLGCCYLLLLLLLWKHFQVHSRLHRVEDSSNCLYRFQWVDSAVDVDDLIIFWIHMGEKDEKKLEIIQSHRLMVL